MDASIGLTDQTDGTSASLALVGDRYRLEAVLGVGGMGQVHLATDTRTDGFVAVKTLRPEFVSDLVVRTRLQREGFIGGQIRSPYVAQVLDQGEDPNYGPYIVFEHLEGEPLSSLVERRRSLAIQDAVEIVVDVLRGLEAFHQVGLSHRDVKPENVFLVQERGLHGSSRLAARLIDFGLSRAILSRHDGTERVTLEGIIAGTPEYMAPEQISDAPAQDERVDLYATGVMLYQMIGGQVPYSDTKPEAVFRRVLYEPLRSLEHVCPGVDPDLVGIIDRALSRHPSDRHPSASAMRLALVEWTKRNTTRRAGAHPGDRTATLPAVCAPRVAPPALHRRLRNPAVIVAASASLTLIATLAIARVHRRPAAPRASAILEASVSPPLALPPSVGRPRESSQAFQKLGTPALAAPAMLDARVRIAEQPPAIENPASRHSPALRPVRHIIAGPHAIPVSAPSQVEPVEYNPESM